MRASNAWPIIGVVGLASAGWPALAQRGPAFVEVADDPALPRVLLIGDSISIGYTVPTRQRLDGKANVHRIPTNGGPTINGLKNLDTWLGHKPWDLIHFNWGLHDLKVTDGGMHQVPMDAYERNLRALVARLRRTGAQLIWASTTPVPTGKLSPLRRPGDEVRFNAVARRVMDANGIAVNDLYAFARPRLADIQRPSNVHFTEAGSRALGARVAEEILQALTRAGQIVEFVPVFTAGDDGYHTYRIPALIVSPAGTLLAFAEGRKNNRRDHGDIDLMLKRSSDGGRTWGPPQIVYEEGGTQEITIGNPCPVIDRDTGTIWLPFCRDNDDVFITHSTDDGKTWSAPTPITGSVKKAEWSWYATGPGVGIQLRRGPHKGRLVIPCDHRRKGDATRTMYSHVFYSDDHGRSWTLGGSLEAKTDECQLVERTDGTLLLNMRSYHGENRRAIATSDDGGATWSKVHLDPTLIEPVCQASFVRYSEAGAGGTSRVLFSNPASTKRERLTVRLSYDDAASWPVARVLHAGPAAYSALAALPDGAIGCLFERGTDSAYESITFARFWPAWLTRGGDDASRDRSPSLGRSHVKPAARR